MKSIEGALGRLDGVKKAKMDGAKTEYKVSVVETTFHLPSKVKEAVPSNFPVEAIRYKVAGVAEKKDDAWIFTARASKVQFKIKGDNEDLKKLLADGKTKLTLTGSITEPEKDKKEMPTLEVAEAAETTEKK